MIELKKTTDLVKSILEEKPETRSSDNLLYIEVLNYYSDRYDFDIGGFPFADVLRSMSKWHLPSLETVGRCRRRLQHSFPELAATDEVEGYRIVKEKEFRDWAVE